MGAWGYTGRYGWWRRMAAAGREQISGAVSSEGSTGGDQRVGRAVRLWLGLWCESGFMLTDRSCRIDLCAVAVCDEAYCVIEIVCVVC